MHTYYSIGLLIKNDNDIIEIEATSNFVIMLLDLSIFQH